MRLLLLLVLLGLSLPAFAAPELLKDINKLSAREIEQRLPNAHPANYYIYAGRLWSEGQRDDAIFWIYVAQIRYRFHLAANPKIESSGDPALFSSLPYSIGEPINLYAGGDINNWLRQIDRALDWDDKNPNGFTSKVEHAKELETTRTGLAKLRHTIKQDRAKFEAQREEQGIGEVGLIRGTYMEERKPKMPKAWPTLLDKTALSAMAGVFSADREGMLGPIFFSENQHKVISANAYELSVTDGSTLVVIAKKNSVEILRTSHALKAKDGAWNFEEVRTGQAAGLAEGSLKTTYTLRLNAADELVIQRESLTTGKYPNKQIPVRLTYVNWNRAKRIVPTEPAK